MKTLAACLLVALMTPVTVAYGQYTSRPSSARPGCPAGRCQKLSQDGPSAGNVGHSATAPESLGRGMAAVIEAQGRHNLLTSQAVINVERHHQLQIENQRKRVECYYALRKASKDYRAAQSKAARQKARQLAQDLDAQPDDNSDTTAVNIEWPSALQQPKFAGYRRLVELTAGKRSKGVQLTKAEQSRLAESRRAVLASLRNASETISAADRDAAKQFLQDLARGCNRQPDRLAADR
jgi:hypothetical protein